MNNKFNIFLLIIALLFAACSRPPQGVLNEKRMTQVIIDLSMAEGAMYAAGITYKTEEKEKYYNSVYEKHKITAEQFDKSLAYYTRNPKKLETIYENVNQHFKDLDMKLEEQEKAEKREKEIQDSIKLETKKRLQDSIKALEPDSLKWDSLLLLITDSLKFQKQDSTANH